MFITIQGVTDFVIIIPDCPKPDLKYCKNERGHDPMKPLTHCERTLQVHRSVQNEFALFSCRCRYDSCVCVCVCVFFWPIRRSMSDSTMLPSYGRYVQPQDPNGGILLVEQGGAPPTENVLASVMCSDEWIGRGGPAPWTPYHHL